ncbi:MFS transporter [Actinophytocola sp.]|uniref:MFS transporter n=1 Tax=Actinophytocola sp. TaxID=1872138 RepID=UPI0025BCBF07|nr:MFS transporter [Actinophytocola sp.]
MKRIDTRWLALAALAVAMLTIGLDSTVLSIALPTLAVDLHANNTALQWFNTAYTLVLAAAMLPAGALGDRYGRKKLLLIGLILFGLASAACAFSVSSGQLIAARAVLGVGAAIMMPLSLGVLPGMFPDQAQRQRALTISMISVMLGLALGPLVGGWLLGSFWWGWVFLLNLPLVVIGAVAVATLVPESRSENAFRLDLLGAVLSTVGILGLTYGFIRFGGSGWGDKLGWGTIVAGVVVLTVFVWWQRRVEHPLVDLGLFTRPGFSWGTVHLMLMQFAMFGIFFTVPQYLQAVLGVDAFGSGLRMLPLIGGLIVAGRAVDVLLVRVGRRAVLTIGFAMLAVGLVLGALTSVRSGYGYDAIWITVLGIGIGFVMPTAMGYAMSELDDEGAGSGSALLNALRQASGTIGVAVLGTVLSTQYRSQLGPYNREPISDSVNSGVVVAHRLGDNSLLGHVQTAFVSGMSAMLWICVGLAALAAVAAAVFARNAPVDATKATGDQSVLVG